MSLRQHCMHDVSDEASLAQQHDELFIEGLHNNFRHPHSVYYQMILKWDA
jgi:hypothetical protein